MIAFRFSLGLSFLLLLTACTPMVEELELVEEVPVYSEYEGVVLMTHDNIGIELGSSEQPDKDEFIDIRWNMGEHIYFVSSKFEFDKSASTIWGGALCEEHTVDGKEQLIGEGVNWLYFEPVDAFWDCTLLVNCDPGDKVFEFRLMVREKS